MNPDYIVHDDYHDDYEVNCERCGHCDVVEEIPFHDYSLYLCRKCAAASYRSGEAI